MGSRVVRGRATPLDPHTLSPTSCHVKCRQQNRLHVKIARGQKAGRVRAQAAARKCGRCGRCGGAVGGGKGRRDAEGGGADAAALVLPPTHMYRAAQDSGIAATTLMLPPTGRAVQYSTAAHCSTLAAAVCAASAVQGPKLLPLRQCNEARPSAIAAASSSAATAVAAAAAASVEATACTAPDAAAAAANTKPNTCTPTNTTAAAAAAVLVLRNAGDAAGAAAAPQPRIRIRIQTDAGQF